MGGEGIRYIKYKKKTKNWWLKQVNYLLLNYISFKRPLNDLPKHINVSVKKQKQIPVDFFLLKTHAQTMPFILSASNVKHVSFVKDIVKDMEIF